MKAVIIAAGQSSRLWQTTERSPKTLLSYGDGTILSTIVDNLKSCGIDEFIMVLGWRKSEIKAYLAKHNSLDVDMNFIYNEDWKLGNGVSVLAAKPAVGEEPFILSMCDHIVSPSAITSLIQSKSKKNVLLVDPRVDDIFDIDDATKVQVNGDGDIVKIGKDLQEYNGIDCGVFRLNSTFFDAMQRQLREGRESISAAVTGLMATQNIGAVLLREDEFWLDIDTPEAYQFALERLEARE